MSSFDLTGMTAVVTGAKGGIRFGMAVALAEAGTDIVGVSATLEPGGSIEQAVTGLRRQFRATRADFADSAAVKDLAVELKALAPDILINKVRGAPPGRPEKEFNRSRPRDRRTT